MKVPRLRPLSWRRIRAWLPQATVFVLALEQFLCGVTAMCAEVVFVEYHEIPHSPHGAIRFWVDVPRRVASLASPGKSQNRVDRLFVVENLRRVTAGRLRQVLPEKPSEVHMSLQCPSANASSEKMRLECHQRARRFGAELPERVGRWCMVLPKGIFAFQRKRGRRAYLPPNGRGSRQCVVLFTASVCSRRIGNV